MAKKSTKFGTFGGVFTPSILTILGVIMYLRLPWVVGNGGLWTALTVILIAHVVSVTTGLSISSIATDKKVGAGGPYYIVSRSLGLPIGGTLGLALFVGLSFSISLYVIGFCESFLAYWDIEATVDNIRIYGTATIVFLTVITLVSTSFAIKTQYVILGLIAVSLIAVGFSPGAAPEVMHLSKPEGGAPFFEIFAIFFPAVTGFTAGVNMSGDLRDPKRSIPVGTLAAIGTGLVVYVGLAIYLSWRIPAEELLSNPNVLAARSALPLAVVGGIWGATLSSGLGSILGAPRILQAMSSDRVTPTFFAKGHGKDNEPRRALLVAFAIGEAGILIGELNAIARLVSIFFIAIYGFLNLSCAIESWASTDFRPEFRIPRWVSALGALVCFGLMVQLDPWATVGASAIFALLFAYLKRRELALESGDTWEGVWSSMVRWGLDRLQHEDGGVQRNWRPNVIALTWRALDDHGPLLGFGTELIRDRGVLTDFRLRTPKEARREQDSAKEEAKREQEEASLRESQRDARLSGIRAKLEALATEDTERVVAGLFQRDLEARDPWEAARAIARFHGFAGLEPNTVLLSWAENRHDRPGFAETIDAFVDLDYNVLLLARDAKRDFGDRSHVDIWWTPDQGSFELGLALVRFLTLSDDWRRAKLRFFLLNDDPSRGDALFKSAQRALDRGRVQATIKVLNNAIGNRPFYDWVRQESAEADLVLMGLPPTAMVKQPEQIDELDDLFGDIGSVIVCRASSTMASELQVAQVRESSKLVSLEGFADALERDGASLAPLRVPGASELAAASRELSTMHDELAAEFHSECLSAIYKHDAALIDQLRSVVERAFDQLGKATAERALIRQRKQLNKIQSGFLFQARRVLSEFENDRLAAQVDALEHRIEGWLERLETFGRDAPKTLAVNRDPGVLATAREDPPSVRRAKRRLRFRHRFQGAQLSYSFNATPLYTYYLRGRSLSALEGALADMGADTYQALLELGRSISEARHALDEFALRLVELPQSKAAVKAVASSEAATDAGEAASPHERAKQELAARIAERRGLVVERLEKLAGRMRKRAEQSRDQLLHASRSLAQNFADDLDRLDIAHLIRNQRRLPASVEGREQTLPEVAGHWRINRKLILDRASLELHNAGFQHRLRAIVDRSKDSIAQTISTGILRDCAQLREQLDRYRTALREHDQGAEDPAGASVDAASLFDPPGVARSADADRDREGAVAQAPSLGKLKLGQDLRPVFDDKKIVEDLAREAQAASAELPDAIEVIGDDALMALEDQPFEDSEVLTVSLRRLVDFLVQAEFLGGLREHTARVAMAEQRAVGVVQDVLHLVSFNLSEYEHERELEFEGEETVTLEARVGPVVEHGLARLDGELEQLRELAPSLAQRIDTQLGKILDRTEAYAITGSEDSFKQYVRHEQAGAGALSRVGVVTRWAQGLSKEVLVGLLYRWSESVLLARQIRDRDRGNVVERMLAFVNDNSPRRAVLDALPFYYTQPFLGQARVSVEFWVGREAEVDEVAEAVRNWRAGRVGSVLIVGERLSGKTSLARYCARKLFDKRNKYNLLAPRGGSSELGLFKSRLAKELGLPAEKAARDWDEILGAVPTGSVIMIHDLELWWERGPGGEAVLDKLIELIARWGDRLCFILELNIHAYRFINRVMPLADQALAVVECQPFAAEQLKQIIEIRHRSTGLRYALDEREEDELPGWNKARLFTQHFDYTGGYVGVALQGWIGHIARVSGESFELEAPSRPSLDPFDELRLEWVALLLQFVLHKRLTRARAQRISGLEREGLERTLETLVRMGLLVEDKQGAIEINRYMQHLLVANLQERGYL